MRAFRSLASRVRRLHSDERGGVSLETVLIIAAVALPILIFLFTIVFPGIRKKIVSVLRDDLGINIGS